VAKERFPQPPSKKAILDFTGRHKIYLCASGKNENWRENLSFRKKKGLLALSQRKPTLDFTGRRKIGLCTSGENENWRENLSFRKKKGPLALSQRKPARVFTGRLEINAYSQFG